MLKNQIITEAANLMQNHESLPPQLFGSDFLLHDTIKNKLLQIARTLQERFVSFFPAAKVRDIVLTGSMCSYIYSDHSDIDLFIFP